MDFEALVKTIVEIHRCTQRAATKAVNVALTCRNWLIGAYIHEYELQGQDRADYGARLFEQLEKRLAEINVPNCNRSRLYRYRDFYRLYPHILTVLPASYSGLLDPYDRERALGRYKGVISHYVFVFLKGDFNGSPE